MKINTPFNIEIGAFTWVTTPEGVVLADKLQKNQSIFSPQGNDQKVANILSQSPKKVLQIITQNGNSLIVDPKTSFYTLDGWKSAEELTEKDFVLNQMKVLKTSNEGGKSIPYKQELKGNAMPILVPNKMNQDLAKWMGIMCSSGRYNLANGHVSIITKNELLIKEFFKLTEKIFKLKPTVYQDKDLKKSKEYYFISRNVVKFLKQWLGPNFNLRKVPSFIIEGSTQEHLAFLEGLGCQAKEDKKYVQFYKGVSKPAADFCAMTLRNFGYIVYQQQIILKNEGINYYIVRILSKYPEALNIEFLNKELESKISIDPNVLVPVPKEIYTMKISTLTGKYSAYRKIIKNKQKLCSLQTLISLGLEKYWDKRFYFVPISQIKTTEMKTVLIKTLYDQGLNINGLVVGGFY